MTRTRLSAPLGRLAAPFAPLSRGQMLILAAAVLFIALGWIGALAAVDAQRAASLGRIEAEMRSKSDLAAEQLRRELLVTDQSLRILEMEWERDPAGFDFDRWQRRVLSLSDATLQVFITDPHGIVRKSSRPTIIGDDVAARDYFQYFAALPKDNEETFIGGLTQGLVTRRWQLNLARRLDRRDQSFDGVVVASLGIGVFARVQREVDLGPRGILLVTAPDGTIRGVGDPSLAGIVRTIAGSELFRHVQAGHAQAARGVWSGEWPADSPPRVFAFTDMPERGMRVVVGMDRAAAMRAAGVWTKEALIFTAAATALVLLVTMVLLWTEQVARRLYAATLHDREVLAQANAQLEAAEARERAKAEQLQATLAGMSDGIMMMDADLRLLAWNQHFAEFTGVPPAMLRVGLPMQEMLRAQAEAGEFGEVDAAAEVERRMNLLRQGGGVGTIERQRPDGRVLEIRRNPLPGGGFVTLYADVTARRRSQERARQAQTMAAVGRLTSGVAHDFNNLLASISGNAEIMLRDLAAASREARRAAIILQAAGRGAELVRQLLAFARKQALLPRPTNLNAVLGGISELLRTTLGPTIRVEIELDPQLWRAMVDPAQIEHALLNLAINARDAMPQGGVLTIATSNVLPSEIDVADDLPAGEYVMVTVRDTGMGMTEDVKAKAFEPFFTTKPVGRGSGLGLSQVYGLARQSGGSVRISSRPGRGTTIRLYLPSTHAPGTQAGADGGRLPSRPDGGAAGLGRASAGAVLVVDDEESVCATVAAMAQADGFTVETACSGKEALRLMAEGRAFSVVLADVGMPEMTGRDLARAIHERWPALPVVFMTGYDEGEDIDGARWILRKPFSLDAMLNVLRAAMDGIGAVVG